MGLSLGVKVGDAVLVGPHVIEIREIATEGLLVKCGGRAFDLSSQEKVAVQDDVFMRRGIPKSGSTYPRVDIEAPRELAISLYRKDRNTNLQQRILRLCELSPKHPRPHHVLTRLCGTSERARCALEAILLDPAAPRFSEDWQQRFKYLVGPVHQVRGGLPSLRRI